MVSCAQNRDANNVEKRDSLKFDIKAMNADKGKACYEQSPSFRGGNKAFLEYVQQHIQYPKSAYVRGVEGRVIVGCFVEKEVLLMKSILYTPLIPYLTRRRFE